MHQNVIDSDSNEELYQLGYMANLKMTIVITCFLDSKADVKADVSIVKMSAMRRTRSTMYILSTP